MATAQIRSIINNQVDRVIIMAQQKVEEEKQKAIQRIKDEIPTREDIIAMLTSYACEPKAQEIMKGVYEKTDNLLGKLETMSTNAEQTVSKIKAEIDKVSGEVLPYIATVFDIMNGVMLVAKELVRASPAALAASSGPSANGLVIKKTGDGMTMAKVKVKEYSATIAAIKKYTEIVLMVCLEIIGLVASMLLLITRLKTMIVYVRDMLLFYYLKYLSLCENPEIQDSNLANGNTWNTGDGGAGGIDPDGDLNSSEVQERLLQIYQDLIASLEAQGKQEIKEYVKLISSGYLIRFERKIVPL